jgi:hypothetical protein
MFDFKSYDLSTRLKAKSLLAAAVVGGGGGVLATVYGSGDSTMVVNGFVGLVLVVVGGHAGGFAGLLARSLWGMIRGRGGRMSDAGTDAIMPVLAFGSLLGLVFWLIFADWGGAHWGATLGAIAGGAAGGMAGENVGNMLRLLLAAEDEKVMRRQGSDRLEIKDFAPNREPKEK